MSDKFSINEDDCLELLSKWSFGTLFTYNSSHVSHLPYIMNGKDTIELHLANSNPQLCEIEKTKCIFDILGPHSLITTDFYVSKPAVPTWNYASVTVLGHCEVMSSKETERCIDSFLERFEPTLLSDKTTLPDAVKDHLITVITGIKIHIHELSGKVKFGQNRSLEDQKRVYDMLNQSGLLEYIKFYDEWFD